MNENLSITNRLIELEQEKRNKIDSSISQKVRRIYGEHTGFSFGSSENENGFTLKIPTHKIEITGTSDFILQELEKLYSQSLGINPGLQS